MEAGWELEKARQRVTQNSEPRTIFEDLWPSPTKGDGVVRKNNSRTGAAQGKGSFLLKAPCRFCGFLNDLSRVDHSGGSLDGNGAAYVASTGVATSYPTGGGTHTENYGEPATRVNAGCGLCGSKNSSAQRILTTGGNPWDRIAPLGF
jgi:hypothetical protein